MSKHGESLSNTRLGGKKKVLMEFPFPPTNYTISKTPQITHRCFDFERFSLKTTRISNITNTYKNTKHFLVGYTYIYIYLSAKRECHFRRDLKGSGFNVTKITFLKQSYNVVRTWFVSQCFANSRRSQLNKIYTDVS